MALTIPTPLATLIESTIDGQNAQRNFIISDPSHQVTISILCHENVYREGEEPTLEPVDTFTNQSIANLLTGLAANLIRHPIGQRLPLN